MNIQKKIEAARQVTMKILTNKPALVNGMVFLLILCATLAVYGECRTNYFFSDDFEWLARGILAQNLPDAPGEITRIEGRDFNPVFIIIITIMIRIFGLSAPAFRLLCLLTFAMVIFMFYYILSRYFRVNRWIALSAALLCGFNVFISEVALNVSALVYTLSLVLFLVGLKFFLDGKPLVFLAFLLAAFLAKETVMAAIIPLLFLETGKKKRRFIIISFGGLLVSRMLLQWITATPGKYTSFLDTSHLFYKLYFISMRALGVSPYAVSPIVGAGILIGLALVTGYFIFSKNPGADGGRGYDGRGFLFFTLFFAVFALFFSLLPKLSSRYFLFPSIGLWGIAALLTQYFQEQNKKIKYVPVALLLVSLPVSASLIKQEIEDYKILGDFSKQFIRQQAAIIENKPGAGEITLYKTDSRELGNVYRRIKDRQNLPKLLPSREHGIGGVIDPAHLIPLVFYPGKIVRWYSLKESPGYFTGRLIITGGDHE